MGLRNALIDVADHFDIVGQRMEISKFHNLSANAFIFSANGWPGKFKVVRNSFWLNCMSQ
jgi:hypothetical protein